jgi:hypothetical protein
MEIFVYRVQVVFQDSVTLVLIFVQVFYVLIHLLLNNIRTVMVFHVITILIVIVDFAIRIIVIVYVLLQLVFLRLM